MKNTMNKNERWKVGQTVPDFSFTDSDGNASTFKNKLKEGKVYLTFYRYASCPFCNLRVHQVIQRAEEFKAAGLVVVGVFESGKKIYDKYAGKQKPPFTIILDPDKKIYQLFRVEKSWLGVLRTFFFHGGGIVKAMTKGFIPGAMDGSADRMVADFILDSSGKIEVAHYGKHAGDHLPIEEVLKKGVNSI